MKIFRALTIVSAIIATLGYLFIATTPAGWTFGNPPTVDKCYTNSAYSGTPLPGHFTVSVTEAPICTTGKYAATYHLQSDGIYTVTYNTETWVCTAAHPTGPNGNFQCLQNGKFDSRTINVQNSANVTTLARSTSELGFSNACGSYQTDFSFYYTDHSGHFCRFGTPFITLGYSTCTTNINCVHTTPTPTPTSVPTPTPTVKPTPTPTPPAGGSPTPTPTHAPTPTPTNMPTPTPTHIPTPTPTSIPTPTPTAGPTPTGNPTPAPTATPNPTPTAVPTNVPTPTPTLSVATPTPQSIVINNTNNNTNNNTVNVTVTPQQQVLAVSTTPTTLPATGPIGSVVFGLLGLIPLGLKFRKSAHLNK